MVEVKARQNIESIEKIDIGFMKRKSKAKSFLGLLVGDLARARNDKNSLLVTYIEERIRDYHKFHTKAMVELVSWKGKSGIQVIQRPDSFDVIRYRKWAKGEEPKELIKNYPKEQVNLVINALNLCQSNPRIEENIPTREIAREFCNLSNLHINTHDRPLFEVNGFIWDNFFADRHLHASLNDILGLLDYYKVIEYRGGFSKILKKTMNIQEILKFQTP